MEEQERIRERKEKELNKHSLMPLAIVSRRNAANISVKKRDKKYMEGSGITIIVTEGGGFQAIWKKQELRDVMWRLKVRGKP